MHRALILFSALATLSLTASGAEAPNVIWINCEDLSPAAVGAYGDDYADTPSIDRLAEEGILYRHAYSWAPICSPARSTFVTGVYATSLGTQHLHADVRRPEHIKPLPLLLRERGYFTSNWGKTGWNFDSEGAFSYWDSDDLAPWRKREEGQPFFCTFVFGTTHEGPVNRLDRYEKATGNLPEERRHDPADAKVPPYFPDTPGMRAIWARYFDTATALDLTVGAILDNLAADGLDDETIVIFFSDHGFGLPRHKRWLNDSGLRVPMVVRVPERFREMATVAPGGKEERLVSFVDLAPTTLSVLGMEIPGYMQGRPFLGEKIGEPREFLHGARSRADDMFETSRSVFDGRYFYVRHFRPHLPYIQGGWIYGEGKLSFLELYRARDAGELPPESALLFAREKPIEELYDLENDPHEIRNLAREEAHRGDLERLRSEMREWVLETRDTGFLAEAELHARAGDRTRYDYARDREAYRLPEIFDAAERVGDPLVSVSELRDGLTANDSGVRYWSAVALLAKGAHAEEARPELRDALADSSASVRIAAAEALCELGEPGRALSVLAAELSGDDPLVTMMAARALFQVGEIACEVREEMEAALDRYVLDPEGARGDRYLHPPYGAAVAGSLRYALENCGE